MKSLSDILKQLRSIYPAIILILTVSAFFVGIVLFLSLWKGIPIGHLTRDPATLSNTPFYTGFLSNIGIFFWSATATVCIFSGMLVSRRPDMSKTKQFLYVSGLLTLLLGFDDVFLFHEEIAPFYIGMPEFLVEASYPVIVLFYLIRFYAVIFETDYLVLGMALSFFGISMGMDVVSTPGIDQNLLEDGAKFVGIVSWLVYFARVAESALHWQATYR